MSATAVARLASVAFLFASIPPVAFASGAVVLLPAGGDAAFPDERAHAQAALSLALEGQGFRVLAHDAVVHDDGACASVDCAPVLLRAVGADLAAAVAVWGEPHAGSTRPAQVFVTLVDVAGNRYPGAARVSDAAVAAAARTAVLDARALQLLGPGPWLRVRGTPDGAEVRIDDKLVGSLPYRARIDAGRHALEVRADGMRSHVESVNVPPNPGRVVEIDVALAPGSGAGARRASAPNAAPATPRDSAESSRADATGTTHPIVGPVVLGSVGLAVGVYDLVAVLDTGCTRRDSTGTCLVRRDADAGTGIALGAVSAAALVGAVLWYVLGTEDASATGGAHPMTARAGIRFAPWNQGPGVAGAF